MLDVPSQQLLTDLLQRESRSLLSYMVDAYPWTTVRNEPALSALQTIVKRESDAVTALGRYLVRHKIIPPTLPSYPAHFTSLNFLALDHLLPKLIESQKVLISRLEADLHRLTKDAQPPARALLAAKQESLAALTQLQGGTAH